MELNMSTWEAESEGIGFITSDNPCIWYDSAAYKRPPLYRAPALAYETIEITLPISPRQCLWLGRSGIEAYAPANDMVVDEINRRTRFQADTCFIVNRNKTKPIWFHAGIKSEDSWDKLHGRLSEKREDD